MGLRDERNKIMKENIKLQEQKNEAMSGINAWKTRQRVWTKEKNRMARIERK